jgi:hypothetical protein
MNAQYTQHEFVDFYMQIGIEIGRLCNARCEHCISFSGPENRQKMELETALRVVREAASVGLPRIEITGGEPFLFLEEIEEIMRLGKSYGMWTGVTTNSTWAKTPERAVKILTRLKDAGLSLLRFSIDQYHLNYIPLERVQNAVQASLDVGVQALIEASVGRKDYRTYKAVHTLKSFPVEMRLSDLIPYGRGAELPTETFFTESFYKVAHAPCSSAGVPVVETDGRVLLCCAFPVSQDPNDMESPFVLGSVKNESLANILARHLYNPFLRALRYEGPGALLRILEEKYGNDQYKPRANYPGSICTLCMDMMNHARLKELWHESVAENDRSQSFSPPVDLDKVFSHAATEPVVSA